MRYRFPVTGLLFISIALWLVSCAEGGSSTGNDTSGAARGWAFFAETPQIVIFSDEETSREQLLGVFAHEVGHVLHEHGFEGGFSVHRGLNEGLANWAAAHYWNAWQDSSSFDASIRTYLENSLYLPLYENYDLNDVYPGVERPAEPCIRRRDILYTEWASFLDFLIQNYGMEKLRELFATAPAPEITETQRIIRPPDYPAVYGSALNQLEAAWLQDIARSQ